MFTTTKRFSIGSYGYITKLVMVQHRLTGIARTYFDGYDARHPRHWSKRFEADRLNGEFEAPPARKIKASASWIPHCEFDIVIWRKR